MCESGGAHLFGPFAARLVFAFFRGRSGSVPQGASRSGSVCEHLSAVPPYGISSAAPETNGSSVARRSLAS